MTQNDYHRKIVDYYRSTENAYKDSWDLAGSLAIHYGYWDKTVRTFRESLLRMNEVMMDAAAIKATDRVLDAGCGVGGSSIHVAARTGATVTGISLSERQVQQAHENARSRGVEDQTNFAVMDYSATTFPDASFDVVWGCESICYADNKKQFIQEAFRLLRPGGRLVVADGFVTNFDHNEHPIIRNWLDGWQVNYLETPGRFTGFMQQAGFDNACFRDITAATAHSSRRLYRFYWLASAYVRWRKLASSHRADAMQIGNIRACKFQRQGMKKGLWNYGMITGTKP